TGRRSKAIHTWNSRTARFTPTSITGSSSSAMARSPKQRNIWTRRTCSKRSAQVEFFSRGTSMFMEIVRLQVKAGQEGEFEATVKKLMPGFKAIKGFQSYELRRSVEEPSCFYLLAKWEKLEDHTVTYANSEFRKEVGPALAAFVAAPPKVEHGKLVAS